MLKLINLTPHEINIILVNGEAETIPSSGVARVQVNEEPAFMVNDIKVVTSKYGEVEGLPDMHPDHFLIVSALVRAATPHRPDLLSPAGLIRDDKGRITGCQYLTR